MRDILSTIDERELQWVFVQSSGPGGQNVNKVATAVQLRFDVAHSPSVSEEMRKRLVLLAGRRLTQDGLLIIEAKRYRTQERNREDALKRLADLLQKAHEKPKTRRKTKPTFASQQKRLSGKKRRSEIKRLRGEYPGRDGA
jgi:ribosome-associated protein